MSTEGDARAPHDRDPDPQVVLDARFQRLLREERDRRRPPVHAWNPPDLGPLDIRIDREGRWIHEGREIRRPALVRLFAGILRREGVGTYYLVTPTEKYRIAVEDAPFLGVDFEVQGEGTPGQQVLVTTNVGDHVLLDEAHPLEMRRPDDATEPRPYFRVRAGLEGRLTRSAYYRLVELAELRPPEPSRDGSGAPAVEAVLRSAGAEFPLGRVDG